MRPRDRVGDVDADDRAAVLVTGIYGSGKSSVAVELVEAVEARGLPYALLDLDFLGWGAPPGGGEDLHGGVGRLLVRNLTSVADNFRDEGIRYFVLAGFVRDAQGVQRLEEAIRTPLRVVRLTVPWPEIERRLGSDPTTGRADDLRMAADQFATSEGEGIEDIAVDNDRPVGDVAAEILTWLGWPAES